MSEFKQIQGAEVSEQWEILEPMVSSALARSCYFASVETIRERIEEGTYALYRATSSDYQSAIAVVDYESNYPSELWANLVIVYVDPAWPEGRNFLVENLHDALRDGGCTHAHFFSVRKGGPWLANKHGYEERFVEYMRRL